MIDSRAGLQQDRRCAFDDVFEDLAGDSLGLPCARIRAKKQSNGLPTE